MECFTESNHLLSDPPALRQQFNADGYLFLRDTLPKPEVLSLRRQIFEFCQEEGWLRKGTDVIDGDSEEMNQIIAQIRYYSKIGNGGGVFRH